MLSKIIPPFLYYALSIYSFSTLINIFGNDYQLIICILSLILFIFCEVTKSNSLILALKSRYSLIIYSLSLSFVATGSLTCLRELIIALPVICFLTQKRIHLRSLKLIAIFNLYLTIIGFAIFLLISSDGLQLSSWRVSELPFFLKQSTLYLKDTLFYNYRCMFAPLYIFHVEVIRHNCYIMPNESFRFYFHFIEPVASLLTISLIAFLYSVRTIKSFSVALLLSIAVFLVSPNTTILIPLAIIFALFIYRSLKKIRMPNLIKKILLSTLVLGFICSIFFVVTSLIPQKAATFDFIFQIFSDLSTSISLFGFPSDSYDDFRGYGVSFILVRYGLVGIFVWLFIYMPILFQSIRIISNKPVNLLSFSAGITLLLLFSLGLRYNTLLNPMLLLMSTTIRQQSFSLALNNKGR